MNQSVVSEKTQELYKNLQQNQEAITKQLSQPTGNRRRCFRDQDLCRLDKDVNDRVADLEKGIKAERDKLDEHRKEHRVFCKSEDP